jgi:hypothetical protein
MVCKYFFKPFSDNNFTLLILCNILIDDDDICNNPNFHSEEQNEFEIPDGKVYLFIFRIFI